MIEYIVKKTAEQCVKLITQSILTKDFDEAYLENCIIQSIINAEVDK